MTSAPDSESPQQVARPDNATIIRDAIVFQAKLLVDGLRDAILIPISFGAAIISILLPGRRGLLFYDVVRVGRRSERWIDLFVAAERVYPDRGDDASLAGLDDLLEQVEDQLRSQYRPDQEGRPAGSATRSILERIRAARRRYGRGEAAGGED